LGAYLPSAASLHYQNPESESIAAYRILARALQEPYRTLLVNAGYEPGHIFASPEAAQPGWGLDLRSGQVVDMWTAGIIDPASVVKAAVRSAVTSAALLLTTDVLVHKRNPDEAAQTT
jgi:chaperonin GroEL